MVGSTWCAKTPEFARSSPILYAARFRCRYSRCGCATSPSGVEFRSRTASATRSWRGSTFTAPAPHRHPPLTPQCIQGIQELPPVVQGVGIPNKLPLRHWRRRQGGRHAFVSARRDAPGSPLYHRRISNPCCEHRFSSTMAIDPRLSARSPLNWRGSVITRLNDSIESIMQAGADLVAGARRAITAALPAAVLSG